MEYNDQNFLKRSEPINEIIPTKKSRKSITLLIIAASRRARGICYIGFSFEEDYLFIVWILPKVVGLLKKICRLEVLSIFGLVRK